MISEDIRNISTFHLSKIYPTKNEIKITSFFGGKATNYQITKRGCISFEMIDFLA